MTTVKLDKQPGYYLEPITMDWIVPDDANVFSYTINGPQPAISEYIAYDTLSPPNPFLAVTQDGHGNVVYDGGFPKYYNFRGPGAGATHFNHLNGSFKFLYNAINWTANPRKLNNGIRRVLLLGDRDGGNYRVKYRNNTDFRTSFERLTNIAGYDLTIKDHHDYTDNAIDASLEELDYYNCVVIMSSDYGTGGNITSSCIQNLIQYREAGNGLIVITDHGDNNITTLDQATDRSFSRGFYGMANRIVTNFGCWFSGNYNRTNVNVGFLRRTYGDHPLYNGMADSEHIHAGGSESEVVVSSFDQYTAATAPTINLTDQDRYIVRTLTIANDGSIETARYAYSIAVGEILNFMTMDRTIINETPLSFSNFAEFMIEIDGHGLGDMHGDILKNGLKIGEISYSEIQGSREMWYSGTNRFIPVQKGDVFVARINTPFSYERTLTINRHQPDLCQNVDYAFAVTETRDAEFEDFRIKRTLEKSIFSISEHMAHLDIEYRENNPKDITVLRDYFCDRLELPKTEAFIFPDSSATAHALNILVPPSIREIFDSWDRFNRDEYFPNGDGATNAAADWYWDDDREFIVQPHNQTQNYSGFVSHDTTEFYEHDVILQSDNGDDDLNGVILAFYRNEAAGTNHTLELAVTRGGIPPAVSHSILVDTHEVPEHGVNFTRTARRAVIMENNFAGTDGVSNQGIGWAGRWTRIYVIRNGDLFTTWSSHWNSNVLVPESKMEFSLNDHPLLRQFRGPMRYGYGNFSQALSYFHSIHFRGGILWDIVVNAETKEVYRYFDDRWNLLENVRPQDIFGSPRTIAGLENNIDFHLNKDGSISW